MEEQRSTGVGAVRIKKRGRPSGIISADIRTVILDEARKLFVVYGYEATSISAIATHSKIVPNTVYYYFASKEILWREIYQEAKQVVWGGLNEAAVVDKPLVESLLQSAEAAITLREKFPYRTKFLYRAAAEAVFNPSLADIQIDRLRNQEAFFEKFAKRGLESGELAKLGSLTNATRTLQLLVMGFFFESHGAINESVQVRDEMLKAIRHLVAIMGE